MDSPRQTRLPPPRPQAVGRLTSERHPSQPLDARLFGWVGWKKLSGVWVHPGHYGNGPSTARRKVRQVKSLIRSATGGVIKALIAHRPKVSCPSLRHFLTMKPLRMDLEVG